MNSPPFTFLLSLISNACVHAARLPTGAGTAFTTSSQGKLFRRQGVEACSPQTAFFSLPHLLEPSSVARDGQSRRAGPRISYTFSSQSPDEPFWPLSDVLRTQLEPAAWSLNS